jgi:ABC-2 type transport system permease protein
MSNRKQRFSSLLLTLILAGANLIAVNYLVSGWSTARVDLTEEGLFSISEATERIVTGLEEELTIYGYFSKRTHPKLAPLIPELTDLLDEYRAVSGGRIHVEIVDPGQDEAAEEVAAERFGVRSTPFRFASKYEAAIVNAYFALVVKYGDQYVRYGFDELIEIDAAPGGDIEVSLRNPEYDLTRAIKKVVFGFRSTNELFERIDGDVTLTAIWTPDSLPELFAETPEAVRKAVEELEEAGGERFEFQQIDPTGDEQLMQRLYDEYGARPMSLGLFSDAEFYLYALLDVGGRLEQIVLADEGVTAADVREAVESALRRQTPGFLKTVGVVTSDPPPIPPQIRMQMQLPPQPPPEFEEIKAVLGQDYRIETVDLAAAGGVPSNVDLLLVLKPQNLDEQAIYGLDQYLMRGGRIILCAGNYSVNFQQGLSLSTVETGLDAWLEHHGITIDPTLVLDDRNQPLPIPEMRSTPFGTMQTWTLAPYPYLVQVRDEGFLNREITASLDAVGIYWGSPLKVDEAATAGMEVIPILQSSPVSWTSDDLGQVAVVDYTVPSAGTEPQLLALALNGKFKSYFADRALPGEAADPEEESEPGKVALEESPETRLIVVGNAEFLSDFVARALAGVDGGFFVENLRFAQNLIDWANLDNDMLGIRARGMASRRLERIGEGRELFIESVNYALPVVLLGALGSFLHWRRREVG